MTMKIQLCCSEFNKFFRKYKGSFSALKQSNPEGRSATQEMLDYVEGTRSQQPNFTRFICKEFAGTMILRKLHETCHLAFGNIENHLLDFEKLARQAVDLSEGEIREYLEETYVQSNLLLRQVAWSKSHLINFMAWINQLVVEIYKQQ